jgi:hypothetical protein
MTHKPHAGCDPIITGHLNELSKVDSLWKTGAAAFAPPIRPRVLARRARAPMASAGMAQ